VIVVAYSLSLVLALEPVQVFVDVYYLGIVFGIELGLGLGLGLEFLQELVQEPVPLPVIVFEQMWVFVFVIVFA